MNRLSMLGDPGVAKAPFNDWSSDHWTRMARKVADILALVDGIPVVNRDDDAQRHLASCAEMSCLFLSRAIAKTGGQDQPTAAYDAALTLLSVCMELQRLKDEPGAREAWRVLRRVRRMLEKTVATLSGLALAAAAAYSEMQAATERLAIPPLDAGTSDGVVLFTETTDGVRLAARSPGGVL